MSISRLQRLYEEALAHRPAATGCVSPEQLVALIERQGSEEERLAVLDHVMACPDCRREFDLLRALHAAGSESSRRATLRSFNRRMVPLALAASLVLAIGIGLAVRNRSPGDVPRGEFGKLVLLAPSTEVVAGRPITFAWRSLTGAQRYQLEVLDQGGNTVFSEATGDTTLTWSGGQLRAGQSYRWWVRDLTPGSQESSPLRPLRVRRE